MKTEEMTIEEGNVLIAVFDGYEKHIWSNPKYADTPYYMKKGVAGEPEAKHFKYHKDWNALMPVVEKIESLTHPLLLNGYFTARINKVSKLENYCPIEFHWNKVGRRNEGTANIVSISRGDSESKIEAIWSAVVQFIEWHNQQKQQH